MMKISEFQLNTTEDGKPYAVYFDDGKQLVTHHWHKEIEIAYCTSGVTVISVGNTIVELKPGESAFIPGGISHSYLCSENHRRLIILLSTGFLDFLPLHGENRKGISEKLNKIPYFSREWAPEIFTGVNTAFGKLSEVITEPKSGKELAVMGLIYEALYYLNNEESYEASVKKPFRENRPKHFTDIGKILSYIDDNYKTGFTLHDVASHMGFAVSYFARMFKRYFGCTFMEYLRDYRVNRACELLTESTMSVAQVAVETGFDSLQTFNRVFKSVTGKSPRQYTKESQI